MRAPARTPHSAATSERHPASHPRLKALGGSWNKTLKGWIFQPARKAEVLALLRADPTNTVTEGAVSAPAAGSKRARDGDDFVVDDDEAVESDDE